MFARIATAASVTARQSAAFLPASCDIGRLSRNISVLTMAAAVTLTANRIIVIASARVPLLLKK